MTDSDKLVDTCEGNYLKPTRKWELICIISNIIFSVVYALGGWIFVVLGLMVFSLGFSDVSFSVVCSLLAALLCFLVPVFCVLGIVFSIKLRKMEAFLASFLIQFLPFDILGIALVLSLLSGI